MTSLSKPKIGRPIGSKNKPSKITLTSTEVMIANKLGVKTEDYAKEKINFIKEDKKARVAAAKTDRLNSLGYQQSLLERVRNLEHQAVGYRAVISYLSHQLGLKQ